MSKKLIIDIWADITCPFCYIGETLLKRELEQWEHIDDVAVRWRSSLLMPDLPLDISFTWQDNLAKVSDPDQLVIYAKKTAVLKHLSDKYGLEYHLDAAYSHNSQRAAQLLKLAGEYGLTLELATRFGKGYFSESKDYSKEEELRATALEAGLSAVDIESVLKGGRFLEEVKKDQELAIEFAPNYVPTIYFNGEDMIDGVLKSDQIKSSLDSAWAKL